MGSVRGVCKEAKGELFFMYDVIFKNVRIVDGTGAPWFYGEVGVKDDEIKEVSARIEGKAAKVVDGKNMVLAPGFIDSHSHSDTCWFVDKRGESKVRQGVTTEVTGQCGQSPAPATEKRRESSLKTREGKEFEWTTFAEYLDALEDNGVGINVVPLVGHGSLRSSAMGYDNRPPSDEELKVMKALLAEALEAGAFGFSSGLLYPPGSYAHVSELVELAKQMRSYGGIYETHMRNENIDLVKSVQEAITVGREGGVPVHISHHKACYKRAWGLVHQSLKLIGEARREGLDVTADQYPYVAGSCGLAVVVPEWGHEGGKEALLARLKDPEICEKLKIESDAKQILNEAWPITVISSVASEKNKFAQGKSITEIAEIWDVPPVDAAFRLLVEEKLDVTMLEFEINEDDVRTVMAHPCVMIGSDSSCSATDGPLAAEAHRAHPRTFGTFPRVLGKYVREEKVLSLEQAIHKMTSMPANRMRLMDRGIIRPGMKADVVLFDPDIVAEVATFANPAQYPAGIEYVMVNGIFAVENGEHTGNIAGRVLRRA
jgi:N-acyl-D-amino-acid deacylase